MSNPDISNMHDRSLPVIGTQTGRVVGSIGILACVLCCVSIPAVVATISALGLGFLRNDTLLLPAEVVSLIILLWVLSRSRRQHGRLAPTILALTAAAIMFWGLMTSGPFTTTAALAGAIAVVIVVMWDGLLASRCRTPA